MRNDAQTTFIDDRLERAELQSDRPRIAILMCTKDGARFLDEQLASLHRQSYAEWRLYVSDDGSRDETLEILRARQREWGRTACPFSRGRNADSQPTFSRSSAIRMSGRTILLGATKMISGTRKNSRLRRPGCGTFQKKRLLSIVVVLP